MEIKVWYLPYCSHCKRLMAMLKEQGIKFESIDAETFIDESKDIEELVGTNNYPILEVYVDQETIYYIPENTEPNKLREGVFTMPYQSVDNLVYQVQQLIK
jgi:glutaredoxin